MIRKAVIGALLALGIAASAQAKPYPDYSLILQSSSPDVQLQVRLLTGRLGSTQLVQAVVDCGDGLQLGGSALVSNLRWTPLSVAYLAAPGASCATWVYEVARDRQDVPDSNVAAFTAG